jgi:NDP-sugar pyrophosphorylase family protein/aminoglycoside/choline kinase family phosphotransferase
MNHPPRKALLLAAGFGTRMRPLTYDTPKPMMPLWGKPLIGHAIDQLIRWGVEDILVNTHHAPQSIVAYCRARGSDRCRIQVSFEPDILGTGGALKRASWFFDKEPFWMMNTDIAADLDPMPMVRDFHREKAVAVLWMHGALGPRTVEMEPGRPRPRQSAVATRILDFASRTPGKDGTYTFCGLQLLSPRILEFLPHEPFSTVVHAYRSAMRSGERVLGIDLPDAFWADLGTPERYLTAHRDVFNARRRRLPGKRLLPPRQLRSMMDRIPPDVAVEGFTAVDENVTLAPNTILRDSVLWNGAAVKRNTSIADSIVGQGATIRGNVESSTAVCTHVMPNDPILDKALGALAPPPSTPHSPQSTPHSPQSTLHSPQSTLHSPQSTLHSPQSTLITLPARGSDRSFERIQAGSKSAILIRYDDTLRPENARYASHARFLLKHGINVPRVLLDLPEAKATLFEDVGSRALDTIVGQASPQRTLKLYRGTLDQLLTLHQIPRRNTARLQLEPPFSPELYEWERNLFADHFLKRHLGLEVREVRKVVLELAGLAQHLDAAPPVLLHRDMQSSNVLLNGRDLALIDFQGMRMGPAAYDLASLLCDPYVMLTSTLQDQLLAYYLEHSSQSRAVRETYYAAAVQRLCQALGAFGRLSAIPETRRFAQHIPNASTMLLRMLEHLDGMSHLVATIESVPKRGL